MSQLVLSATPRQRLYFRNTFSLKSVLLEGPTGTWHHQAEQSEDGRRLRCLFSHPHTLARHKIAFMNFPSFSSIMNDPSYLARDGGEERAASVQGQDFLVKS